MIRYDKRDGPLKLSYAQFRNLGVIGALHGVQIEVAAERNLRRSDLTREDKISRAMFDLERIHQVVLRSLRARKGGQKLIESTVTFMVIMLDSGYTPAQVMAAGERYLDRRFPDSYHKDEAVVIYQIVALSMFQR